MSGYLVWQSDTIAAILTRGSENSKTGNMSQLWIIRSDMSPVEAVQTGADEAICGNCHLRGTLGKRACYVNVTKAPNQVYRAFARGTYQPLPAEGIKPNPTRLGAYGDPAMLPYEVVQSIVCGVKRHTGYTHQWESCDPRFARLVMASVETLAQRDRAKARGYRTFRVGKPGERPVRGEILCPASEEAGKKTQCIRCGLCDGSRGAGDVRKDIFIPAHGVGKNLFKILT